MNYKITNNNLHIDNKTFNISEIDFILLNGKVRVYLSNGEMHAVATGYSEEDKLSTYADLAYGLKNHINAKFIALKGGKLINLNNISSIYFCKGTAYIRTKGFSLELSNLSEKEQDLLNNQIITEDIV